MKLLLERADDANEPVHHSRKAFQALPNNVIVRSLKLLGAFLLVGRTAD